jgi:hypothetical protein
MEMSFTGADFERDLYHWIKTRNAPDGEVRPGLEDEAVDARVQNVGRGQKLPAPAVIVGLRGAYKPPLS